MKIFICLIVFTTLFCNLFCQVKIEKTDIYRFPADNQTVHFIKLQMPYGKSEIVAVEGDTAALHNAGEIKVDIVCTDFPADQSLAKLNSERLAAFYNLFKYLRREQIASVRIVRQLEGATKLRAAEMFHGLLIYSRPRQTKETMGSDFKKIHEILSFDERPEVTSITASEKTLKTTELQPDIASHRKIKSDTEFVRNYIIGGFITSVEPDSSLPAFAGHTSTCFLKITPSLALEEGYISKKDYNGKNRRNIGWRAHDWIYISTCSGHGFAKEMSVLAVDSISISSQIMNPTKPLSDSTILKIFARNKWKKNMDIVGDVTGSMYPYTAQLLLWLKLQSIDSLTINYTFFNDGNDMADRKKKIGKTGGIYSKTCASFSEVLELVKTTMMNGGGGDAPENNVEAMLEAEKIFPEMTFHVLIADNWAPLKDLKLLNKLKKPVRVVLCGVFDGDVNPQYLDLARKTGGSLHLMEIDLEKLASMHEGETISVGNKKFRIVDGKFKDIGNMI